MTATHPGLLAAVLAAPDDDTPRLALADWLDEHGQPERAEFIRLQCALARIDSGPVLDGAMAGGTWVRRSDALRRRERELLRGLFPRGILRRLDDWSLNGKWDDGCFAVGLTAGYSHPDYPLYKLFPPGGGMEIANVDFRRGFVESVTCACADWLAHGPAVVRAQPVTRVTLGDHACAVWPGGRAHVRFSQLADCPELFRPRAAEELRVLAYPSEREALDALSRRCLAWAKGAPAP